MVDASKIQLGQHIFVKPDRYDKDFLKPIELIVSKINVESSIDLEQSNMIGEHPIKQEVTFCLVDPVTHHGKYYQMSKIFETKLDCFESLLTDYRVIIDEILMKIEFEKGEIKQNDNSGN